jgi:hypothetical protein
VEERTAEIKVVARADGSQAAVCAVQCLLPARRPVRTSQLSMPIGTAIGTG